MTRDEILALSPTQLRKMARTVVEHYGDQTPAETRALLRLERGRTEWLEHNTDVGTYVNACRALIRKPSLDENAHFYAWQIERLFG